MSKKTKNYTQIGLVVVVTLVCYLSYRSQTSPSMVIPYPYIINQEVTGLNEAQEAQIVILGDRMGKALDPFVPTLETEISKNLPSALKIYNWSGEHEGLHRSLYKLKQLKSFPKIVAYYGGSEEFYEKKFLIKDRDTIFRNYSVYQDETLSTLLLFAPAISRFVYLPPDFQRLGEIAEDKTKYKDGEKQAQMEIGYKIYENELKELIRLTREKGTKLLFITPPVNLDSPPKNVCDNAETVTMKGLLDDIKLLVDSGKSKDAHTQLGSLLESTMGNAQSYFLMGKVAAQMGDFKEAKRYLYLASAFDCDTWRGNHVINSILRKTASDNEIKLVDFDLIINQQYGQNTLFQDDIFPQHLFYQQISAEITKEITSILKI